LAPVSTVFAQVGCGSPGSNEEEKWVAAEALAAPTAVLAGFERARRQFARGPPGAGFCARGSKQSEVRMFVFGVGGILWLLLVILLILLIVGVLRGRA
jgi:hypothetical protein